jgi:hypothetical protein
MSSIPPTTPPAAASAPARSDASPGFRWERVVLLLIVAGVLAGGWLSRDYWFPAGLLYPKRERAPDGVSWLKFGVTRKQLLELLAANGARSGSIVRPGMAPSAWAAHTDVKINGQRIDQFAVLFSDEERYNYGALPNQGDAALDLNSLMGSFSADARVVGIRWKVTRNFYDQNSHSVPGTILREMGSPHRQQPGIVKPVQDFIWDWPEVEASYNTADGTLIVLNKKEASKVNQNAGQGTLAPMGPPPVPPEKAAQAGNPIEAVPDDQEVGKSPTERGKQNPPEQPRDATDSQDGRPASPPLPDE